MRSCLDDAAAVDSDDLIAVTNRRQAMSDHDHRASLCDLVETCEDMCLALRIERTRRLVEDQDLRVGDEGTCNGDALALSTGKQAAALADKGIVALRHFADETFDTCELCRTQDIFIGRVRQRRFDIFSNRACEEEALLHRRRR